MPIVYQNIFINNFADQEICFYICVMYKIHSVAIFQFQVFFAAYI
jgi:hypothetical protein